MSVNVGTMRRVSPSQSAKGLLNNNSVIEMPVGVPIIYIGNGALHFYQLEGLNMIKTPIGVQKKPDDISFINNGLRSFSQHSIVVAFIACNKRIRCCRQTHGHITSGHEWIGAQWPKYRDYKRRITLFKMIIPAVSEKSVAYLKYTRTSNSHQSTHRRSKWGYLTNNLFLRH